MKIEKEPLFKSIKEKKGCFMKLVIGDIHGCYQEFIKLIEKANLEQDDKIIALGEIIDR